MFAGDYFNDAFFPKPYFPVGGDGTLIFLIDGIDRSLVLKESSLQIRENLGNRGTLTCIIIKKADDEFIPVVNTEIIVEIINCPGQDSVRRFGGTIERVQGGIQFCGAPVFYKVDAVDFNYLADKRVAFNIYEKNSASQIINDVVDQFMTGERVTTDLNFSVDVTIPKFITSYFKCSKVFDDIAKMTLHEWYIDHFRKLRFFLNSARNSEITISSECEQVADFCASFIDEGCPVPGIKFGNISINFNRTQLVTKQYIIAGQDKTEELQDEKQVMDGSKRTIPLRYDMAELMRLSDGTIDLNSITVGGVAVNSIANRDSPEASTAEWLFSKGSNTISQNQDETEVADGVEVRVRYFGLFGIVRDKSDRTLIDRYAGQENASGLFERVWQDESIEDADFADTYANGLLERNKEVKRIIKFKTDQLVFEIGDLVDVNLPELGVQSYRSNGGGFLIVKISTKDIKGYVWRYEVEAYEQSFNGGENEIYKRIEFFGRKLKLNEQVKVPVTTGETEEAGFTMEVTTSEDMGDLLPFDSECNKEWITETAQVGWSAHVMPEYYVLNVQDV